MAGDSVVSFSEYTDAISTRWPLVAASVILGGALGFGLLSTRGTAYESVSRIEVQPLISAGDSPNLDVARQVNTTTERAIAGSQRVAERAEQLIRASGDLEIPNLDDPLVEAASVSETYELTDAERQQISRDREFVEVAVPNDTEILEFTASAGTAAKAQERARSIAHAYLDFRRDNGLAGTAIARQRLLDRETELLEELKELASDIADAQAREDQGRVQGLSYEDISKREELAGIGSRLANIDAISVSAGTILDDADLPDSPSGLPLVAGPILGMLLGLIAGIGFALLKNRGDDRVRDPRAELAEMGLNIFGAVPIKAAAREGKGVALFPIDDAGTEAYRRVQGGLLFDLDNADKSVVLVAGTTDGAASTTVAANLAIAASRGGRRVLLVGADLRNPTLHDRLGIKNGAGLSDVLLGEVALSESMVELPELPNLKVVTAGRIVSLPTPLLQGAGLGRVVSMAKANFDLVVFEAPPVLTVADAVDLGRFCEGAVLVVDPTVATRSHVADSVEQLRRVGTDVLGTILADRAGG